MLLLWRGGFGCRTGKLFFCWFRRFIFEFLFIFELRISLHLWFRLLSRSFYIYFHSWFRLLPVDLILTRLLTHWGSSLLFLILNFLGAVTDVFVFRSAFWPSFFLFRTDILDYEKFLTSYFSSDWLLLSWLRSREFWIIFFVLNSINILGWIKEFLLELKVNILSLEFVVILGMGIEAE